MWYQKPVVEEEVQLQLALIHLVRLLEMEEQVVLIVFLVHRLLTLVEEEVDHRVELEEQEGQVAEVLVLQILAQLLLVLQILEEVVVVLVMQGVMALLLMVVPALLLSGI